MQAATPLLQAFVMEALPPSLRARATSLINLVWNVGWAVSATLAGVIIQRFGYAVPFYMTAVLYADRGPDLLPRVPPHTRDASTEPIACPTRPRGCAARDRRPSSGRDAGRFPGPGWFGVSVDREPCAGRSDPLRFAPRPRTTWGRCVGRDP